MSNFLKGSGGKPKSTQVNFTDLAGNATVAQGGTNQTSLVTTPTASTIPAWDANKNLSSNSFLPGYRTTATAAGTTTLVVGDTQQQYFTGTTTQTVVLPVTSTLGLGQPYLITNLSTGNVTVQSSGANSIQVMTTNSWLLVTVISTSGTGIASWSATYGTLSGSATSASTLTGTLTSGNLINTAFTAPTFQGYTSSSGTYNLPYVFTITSGSATVGATYTNNSVTFTVYATVSSLTQVIMSGSSAPSASGTLTKSTGTGDSTITFSSFRSVLYLKVKMVGGGGGGASGGATSTLSPGNGTASTFGSSLLSAGGGGGGAGGGGTSSLGTGPVGTVLTGGIGAAGGLSQVAVTSIPAGGNGAATPFGGEGGGGSSGSGGSAAASNSGSGGGGGAGGNTAGNVASGAGGSAGGFVDAMIYSPSATYSYAVGSGGSAGTGTNNGGAGGSGYIEVWGYFQ